MAKKWIMHPASSNEIEFIKAKIQEILAVRGMKIDHPLVLDCLTKAGAKVNSAGYTVFPKELQEEALRQVPRKFTLAGMTPEYDLLFPHQEGSFYARGPIGQMYYLDAETGERRECTMADQEDYIIMQQGLEHMSMWGNFTVKAEGFPVETIDLHTAKLCLRHCQKPAYWMPYSADSVRYMIEMCSVIAGGLDKLRQRPFLTLMSCSNPPLGIKYMDSEQIYQAAVNGLPIHLTALPTAGANAPITPQGLAILSTAEVVGQTIMTQIIGPGTPCLLSAFTYAMDMGSMHTLIAPIEMALSRLLAVQVIDEGYNLPAHAFGGGSDSHVLDGQAIAEEAYMLHTMALSGATMIGDLGAFETCMTASPLQMIIANDLVAMAKRLRAGLEINEDTLAVSELLEQQNRESFISTEHTFRHFKHYGLRTKTFDRISRPAWEAKGSKDMLDKARDVYREIKAAHQPVAHAPEVLRELDQIVARADKEMGK